MDKERNCTDEEVLSCPFNDWNKCLLAEHLFVQINKGAPPEGWSDENLKLFLFHLKIKAGHCLHPNLIEDAFLSLIKRGRLTGDILHVIKTEDEQNSNNEPL
jgi:hypothetical protein